MRMKKKKDNKLGIVIKMSSWMLRRRIAKHLSCLRTEHKFSLNKGTSSDRAILELYEGIPSWEVKRGFFKPKIDNLKGGNYE